MRIIKTIGRHLGAALSSTMGYGLPSVIPALSYVVTFVFACWTLAFFVTGNAIAWKAFSTIFTVAIVLSTLSLLIGYFFNSKEGKETGKYLLLAFFSSMNHESILTVIFVFLWHLVSVVFLVAFVVVYLTHDVSLGNHWVYPVGGMFVGVSILFLVLGYLFTNLNKNPK